MNRREAIQTLMAATCVSVTQPSFVEVPHKKIPIAVTRRAGIRDDMGGLVQAYYTFEINGRRYSNNQLLNSLSDVAQSDVDVAGVVMQKAFSLSGLHDFKKFASEHEVVITT